MHTYCLHPGGAMASASITSALVPNTCGLPVEPASLPELVRVKAAGSASSGAADTFAGTHWLAKLEATPSKQESNT
ncbi:hypothetical protein GmRootV35_13550 [Variovorax sp. V35]